MKTLLSFLLSSLKERKVCSLWRGSFCGAADEGTGVWPWVVLLSHSEVSNVFYFFSVFPFLLLSAWYSWMTHRLWVTSWKNWWRMITFSWPTKFALTCMKAQASSSCLLSSRICARLELPLPLCLDPPTLALSLDQRRTGEETDLRGGGLVWLQSCSKAASYSMYGCFLQAVKLLSFT